MAGTDVATPIEVEADTEPVEVARSIRTCSPGPNVLWTDSVLVLPFRTVVICTSAVPPVSVPCMTVVVLADTEAFPVLTVPLPDTVCPPVDADAEV